MTTEIEITKNSLLAGNSSPAENTEQPPETFNYGVRSVLKKGMINVAFRITQPPMHILESFFLASINTQKPGAFAAGGITYVIKNFFVHTPGAFLHLLPIKFDEKSKTKSANLFYAAYITVTGLNTLVIPLMIFSGDILEGIFKLDPITSRYVQDFFRAFAIGSYPLQWFSVNRQFINSLCGDAKHHKEDEKYKLMMPLVGALELGVYATLAYGLITGNWGFPFLGNAGSGYAFSVSAWLAFLASTGGLLLKKSFREYLLQQPSAELIKTNIKMILRDHAPIALRYVAESTNWIILALFAGKINQNSLAALQICTTLLLPVAGPCFSFMHGARALLKDSMDFRKTALITVAIPSIYAALYIFPFSIPPAIRSIAGLFLNQQSPENREAIKSIVQTTAPIMATIEVAGCAALQERIIETWGAQKHEKPNTRLVAKENWIITGNTLVFQSALFLPLAYAIGVKLDYGLPGMAGVYLLCMLALIGALAPRTINFLRNPQNPPQDCWTSFFKCCRRISTVSPDLVSVNDTTPLMENKK